MTNAKKASFPVLPARQWWVLRQKFKQSIPPVVTESYLVSALDMKAVSVKANILPSLRTIGIIDQDGKPSDRALRWRDDLEYPDVCDEIRNQIYPPELLSLASDRSSSRDTVLRWFMNYSGVGESAAGKMTSFYMLLLEADPEQGKEVKVQKANKLPKKSAMAEIDRIPKPSDNENYLDVTTDTEAPPAPSININLEIHISPDSSAEQIDKIFESMATHIYRRKETV